MRVRVIVLALGCFVLGAVSQKLYDASRRPGPPTTGVVASKPSPGVGTEDKSAGSAIVPEPLDLAGEPLWAYGFDRPAAPGERAKPQSPPSRKLRADQDAGPGSRRRPGDT